MKGVHIRAWGLRRREAPLHLAILRPAFDVPGVGRFAIVKDSAGAFIGWITPAVED